MEDRFLGGKLGHQYGSNGEHRDATINSFCVPEEILGVCWDVQGIEIGAILFDYVGKKGFHVGERWYY